MSYFCFTQLINLQILYKKLLWFTLSNVFFYYKYTIINYTLVYWPLQMEVVYFYVYSVINILWENKYGQTVNNLL